MNKYDVAIAYRIYPKFSRGDVYKLKRWDKYKLSDVCLKSSLRYLSGVNFKIYAILDGCPQKYNALFRDLIASDHIEIIQFPGIGNSATFALEPSRPERQVEYCIFSPPPTPLFLFGRECRSLTYSS